MNTNTNYRQHPRYGAYLAYRSAIQRQQVTPAEFPRWLQMMEESEKRLPGLKYIETPAPRAE